MPSLVGKEIGATGYGTMGLTWRPVPAPQEQAFETLNKALELGANFWNGGGAYPENAEKVVLSIKGGMVPGQLQPDGSEKNIRRSVDESLRVLDGKKKLDIFEVARQDPAYPVEHTIKVLAEYVKEGKIGGIGLSEVDAETIRRAAKVHPIAAVEVELSLWSTDILTNDVAKVCAELNIPVVAYSPLGRGALTGALTRRISLLGISAKLINAVKDLATRKGLAPAQIALSWVLSLSNKPGLPTIIPIPGGTTVDKVTQNTSGIKLLSDEELAEVDAILKSHTVAGGRYA
ncbi:hypothetical protein N7468_001867 [Penicillium chermesinum]|uniref:NADP-dependent oxidoreductase domain-containing protein n=1 Tax=Penicillium chermesinum TaxID=63820 RepID=A0A9W9PHP0_9EURO|nr:uncharacterized protein N7468_001867 [Penicillium chermesinum]KAJ5246884.1 hypothetical protein N7468_001867 [Penicillium chermesinum]